LLNTSSSPHIIVVSNGFLLSCNNAVPSADLSRLAIFMVTLVTDFIISVVVLPLLIDPEGVASRFVQNVGYGLKENSSKLLLFYFEILQSL
jgi:ABC-type sugar transport system permease subunit